MNYILVGRPNVGKSSIFNILSKKNLNIIDQNKGTTRDWHKNAILSSQNYFIYDSPGIILNSKKKINKDSLLIIKNLILKTDIIFFVIDFNLINNTQDKVILNWLRKFNKKIILLINKKDNIKKNYNFDFLQYGINDYFFISCSHKLGFNELTDFINVNLNRNKNIYSKNDKDINYLLAIFGKPNSGKSTFFNTLIGYTRSITSSKPGTTTDCVEESFFYKNNKLIFYDTAGIGRNSKIKKNSIEDKSIKRTFDKIIFVDTSIILIDSTKNLDRQDKRIIKLISKKSKSIILVFNKIDLIADKKNFKKNNILKLNNELYQIKNVEFFFISALIKNDVKKIIKHIYNNILNKKYNFKTNQINTWLKHSTKKNQHPLINNKQINFKYAVKIKDNPIIIKIYCNYSNKINKNYIRFLKNSFYSYFNIMNQNMKIIFSSAKNPFI